MKTLRLPLSVFLFALLVGCATIYTGVVTITATVDLAMKSWAALSAKGQTTSAVDAKVIAAHNQYRAACAVAQAALTAYKASGDPTQYNVAIAAAKQAASNLVALIVPLVTPAQATTLQTNLANAKTL
jgi:hypothetical protein